jgi:hypothetical protein
MRGVLSHHQGWSPALMQLVGDVVPPVLSSVMKNRLGFNAGHAQRIGTYWDPRGVVS